MEIRGLRAWNLSYKYRCGNSKSDIKSKYMVVSLGTAKQIEKQSLNIRKGKIFTQNFK